MYHVSDCMILVSGLRDFGAPENFGLTALISKPLN